MATYAIPFSVPPLTYAQALSTLHNTLRLGISPLLETVEDMLAELGDPDLHYECVQVAGTNGKTSTARYTAAVLAGEGLRVALYTSPELVSYTERMEVDGHPVSEASFACGVSAAVEAGRRVNERRAAAGECPYDITEFDLLTVAALVVFARERVDVAVLEVGMGGRWDATSAAKSIRAVAVTGIGLDHTHVLGSTLEAIAAEKAAVIRRGRACVLGAGTATPHTVEDVFLARAAEQGVTPVLLRADSAASVPGIMHPGEPRDHEGLPQVRFGIEQFPRRIGAALTLTVRTPHATYEGLGALKPAYQAANIACAVALAEAYLGRALNGEALFDSVVRCPTPGRFDLVRPDPPVLIDACHNPQSVGAFLAAVDAVEPRVSERPPLLCAVLADKDVDGIVGLLASAFPQVVVTRTSSARALEPSELAAAFRAAGTEPVASYADVATAVDALGEQAFVACGSITLAGEVAAALPKGTVPNG